MLEAFDDINPTFFCTFDVFRKTGVLVFDKKIDVIIPKNTSILTQPSINHKLTVANLIARLGLMM